MIYRLLFMLSDTLPGFNVFRYITFRAALAACTALILSQQQNSEDLKRVTGHLVELLQASTRDSSPSVQAWAGATLNAAEPVSIASPRDTYRVADTLEVEAWHAGDGTIEQVRLRAYPWGVGVQYHPERDMLYAPLFADFFAQLKS